MIDCVGDETNITSFDMIRPNSDPDVSQQTCLSLLEWANYLLEPNAGIDKNDDSELDNDNDLKRPMMSYKITDDEINWKKDTDTNTTVTTAIASVTEEHQLWSKYDWSVENKTNTALRNNIAEALKLTHSRYSKLKRLNNTQQEEKDITELGMLSIMQMHYNATKTSEAKNWTHTFNDISALYHEELNSNKLIDSVTIDTPQQQYNASAPTEANAEIGKYDVCDDSDDDENSSSQPINHTKRFSVFDDEEDEDDPDAQNREDDEEETGGPPTGNEKSDHKSAKTNKSEAAGNKQTDTDHELKEKRIRKRKR